jgi:hypothetical protein
MTRIEEIYEQVLPMLKDLGVEDTPQHRLWALEGFRDGMKEDDTDNCLEKSLYRIAITGEIMILEMKLNPLRIKF